MAGSFSERFSEVGRLVFASAMVGFGVLYVLWAGLRTPRPGPPWPIVGVSMACLVGALFLAFGAALLSRVGASRGALGLAIVLFVYAVVTYLPPLLRHVRNPAPWTSGFEVVALAGAAFVLAGDGKEMGLQRVGEILFSVALVVFGCQHLIYGPFVARLIPGWIPQRLFLAYFTGGAFLAAGAAIGLKRMGPLAGSLIGLMFLLWVGIVHVPYVAGAMRDGAQWTSAFVALGMCGAGFVVGGASRAGGVGMGRSRGGARGRGLR